MHKMIATAKGIFSDTLVADSNPTCFSASRFHGKSVNGATKYDIKTTTFSQSFKERNKIVIQNISTKPPTNNLRKSA